MEDYTELIPDFDSMQELVELIGKTHAKLLQAKEMYKQAQAECIQEAITDKNYWIGNKIPSMKYCETVVAVLGNTAEERTELEAMRGTITELTEKHKLLTGLLQVMRDKLDLFRTMSANERKVYF